MTAKCTYRNGIGMNIEPPQLLSSLCISGIKVYEAKLLLPKKKTMYSLETVLIYRPLLGKNG